MAMGPGKYDAECTSARASAEAEAVVLIVLGGNRGSGFSVQARGELFELPTMLETLARAIRADLAAKGSA